MQSAHSVTYYKTQSVVIHRYIYILRAEWHCDSSDSSKATGAHLVFTSVSQVADKGQQTAKGTSLEAHFSHATLNNKMLAIWRR